jgi:hypothetical protein
MATTITPSLVQQLRLETQREFGESVQPRWKVRERLVNEVRGAVENEHPAAARGRPPRRTARPPLKEG